MIPYLTCNAASERLEPFIDGELAVDEQVALESHLRWCSVCAARLDDMQLIGASMRMRHHVYDVRFDVGAELATMRSSVLERARAEHDMSMPVKARRLFDDMRLLWPALGATVAVLVCVLVAGGVFNAATGEQEGSMAGMIDMLANPGSDRNPRLLDGRVSLPRALEPGPGLVLNSGVDGDVAFLLSAVVTREGRITNYELLLSERAGGRRRESAAELDVDAPAVMAAVKRSRFAPAQDAAGPVAVNVVWLVTRTTVKAPPVQVNRLRPPRLNVVAPAVDKVPEETAPDEAPTKLDAPIPSTTA